MADDEEVRGAPGSEELFAPTGPRRASFTPAPNDAETLQAAANIFDDDAIAEALSAELKRVASGPIPIQRPPVSAPVEEPIEDSAADQTVHSDPEPEPEVGAPEAVAESAAAPEPEPTPEPEPAAAQAPEPVATEPPAWEPAATAEPVAELPVETPSATTDPEPESSPPPEPEPEPAPAVAESPAAPQGPPDWATPLFGTPAPAAQDEPTPPAPTSDPFAPSAPSFAPSNGPFPPPRDSTPEPDPVSTPFPTTDPSEPADSDSLRALYSSAPAPTVAAADAPPPPGYDAPAPESTTLSAIEELQAQLDQRDRDSREYAAWESSMLEVGTPEALAAVDQARAERAGIPSAPSAPVAPPAPPTEEPAVFLPPPTEEPAAFLPPPADDPSSFLTAPAEAPSAFLAAPAEEPASFIAPSVEEPMPFLPPPAEAPAAFLAPPVDEPAAFLAPPAEEPAAFLPPPTEEPSPFFAAPVGDAASPFAEAPEDISAQPAAPITEPEPAVPAAPENPFDIFAGIDHPADPVSVPDDVASPFPGFAPPTDATTVDFEAPADPHELRFDSSSFNAEPSAPEPPTAVWSLSDTPIPDAPVFLEPTPTPVPAPATSVPSPPGPPSWNLDEFVSAQPSDDEFAAAVPTPEEREAAGAPPALVEPPAPDGVADLWRTASEPIAPAPSPEPTPVVDALPSVVEPPPPSALAPPAESTELASAPAPAAPPASGFDDLLVGGSAPDGAPEPQPPGPGFITGDPNPFTEPTIDAATGDRRPFGEGVERDAAVDPSDSTFGSPQEPTSVNTAGEAVAPEYVVVESQPISVLRPAEAAAIVLVAPTVAPAEPVGLEPTPVEQRIGRAARLFWLWFAANSSIAAIVFGTILFALGVSLRQAIVATLAGVALSFLPLGLGTLAGKRGGQPTMVISRATFGVIGNILPALIALFSRLFWAAGLLWVFGAGTADILNGAQLTDGFTVGQLTIIVMVLGFVVAIVVAYFGYALMARVQLVVSIISGVGIVGFIALTIKYVDFTTALSTQDGPWILVVTGAVLVFSFVGLAWANSSADVARYQRPGSSGTASMLWATFGVAVPSFILIAYGALLAASNATLAANIAADPLDSLARLLPVWYPGPLLAATGLSLLSGIVLATYSGGFALQAAGLRLRRSLSTLIIGVLTILIAIIMANSLTDFSQLFRDLATTVAVPVAAWAGIFGSEIMIRKRRFDSHSLLNRGGVYADARWGNIVGLVVISVIGFGLLSATMPGLTWQGYLFSALGVPLSGQLASSDLGVLVALVLGIAFPLVAGRGAVRAQEKAERVAE